jgi:L-threonylcarbamoyladenylate synthase
MFISIKEAANFLRNEEVVAIPTETVYGLAGRIDSETALKKIFSTKERPFFDPLIVHINSIEMAKKYTLIIGMKLVRN